MSPCREYEEELWEAAHGQEPSAALAAHLAGCAACRRSRRALGEAAAGLAALQTVAAPDPRAAVWARVSTPRRAPRLAWAVGLAVCALAAGLVWWRLAPAAPRAVVRNTPTPRHLAHEPAPVAPQQPEVLVKDTGASEAGPVTADYHAPPRRVRPHHAHRARPHGPTPVQVAKAPKIVPVVVTVDRLPEGWSGRVHEAVGWVVEADLRAQAEAPRWQPALRTLSRYADVL